MKPSKPIAVAPPFLAGAQPPDVNKVLDPALYPDLLEAGGLSPALQHVLPLSAGLCVTKADVTSPGWASASKGSRCSQVCVALHQRLFNVAFWNQGVPYGNGWTGDLTEVARAIEAFQVHEASTTSMTSAFSWFVSEQGILHERGADAYVAERWRRMEEGFTSGARQTPTRKRLAAIVSEAAKRAELRQLYPFTSMDTLHFSRTTGFPFTRDCPFALPTEEGGYRVMSADGKLVLGEGGAIQAVNWLVANLPRDCGPAVHGTARSMEP
jgi:hypothetical protein